MTYGYEYFCGANVVVELEGVPVYECVGLAYSVSESKIPIYGYSSRFFDAVARGQVLVQGKLLVNFVDEDYLKYVILAKKTPTGQQPVSPVTGAEINMNLIGSGQDLEEIEGVAEELKRTYWGGPVSSGNVPRGNPHDIYGGVDIKITFGDRNSETGFNGSTNCILKDVYFTGRAKTIQISEDVIIEEYSFFARNEIK